METLKVKKAQVIAKKNDKVNEWYFIQEGSVIQKQAFVQVPIEKNGIIGILENDRFLCDYVAAEDCVLMSFSCKSSEELKNILVQEPKARRYFLQTTIEQRQKMLEQYSDLDIKCTQFHTFLESLYNQYKNICNEYQLEEQPFSKMSHFLSLEMKHKAESWEIENSSHLVKNFLQPYLNLMEQDDSLCVGAIMEISAQMHRVMLGIGEMAAYLLYNKDLLLSESGKDIFQLYFDLAIRAGANHENLEPIHKQVRFMKELVNRFNIYDKRVLEYRWNEYQNYEFIDNSLQEAAVISILDEEEEIEEEKEDCLEEIFTYSELEEEKTEEYRAKILEYQNLADTDSDDEEAYRLRKQLAPIFYDIYTRVFLRAVKEGELLTPNIQMFLNFGFMDVQITGEENTNILYDLAEHLELCNSEHVYTIYEWLKAIYEGRKEPSKNEFDMDYNQYLTEKLKQKKITDVQLKQLQTNQELKVKYEIQNMFTLGNRATFGKISTFCPILAENDFINSASKMLVTVEKLTNVINRIRKVDFSAFYREVLFSDPARGIKQENIMKEVLPDIILMPNAGTKAMMWQETAGVRRDTPARFLFPIFTAVDLEDMMLETIGRYRWEICRKIQGVHWNDIREKSLTAEYCDYIQFYRKNSDLSADAKEKIKTSLFRAKNSYREVFVKDYQNWIKFESKGSFRLNKVSRQILICYCPFSKEVRAALKLNPMYQELLSRYDILAAKNEKRVQAVYDRYKKAGGEITQDLKDNLLYYQL